MRIASFFVPAAVASLLIACSGQPMSTAEADRTTSEALTVGPILPPIAWDQTGAACVGTDAAQVNVCGGNGVCHTVKFSCFPYHCSAGARTCATTCSSNGECATGFQCVSGACTMAPVTVCTDAQTSHNNLTGLSEGCAPTACDVVTGLCKTECVTTYDCAAGSVCDIPNKICVNPN